METGRVNARGFFACLPYNLLLHLLFPLFFAVSWRRHRRRGGPAADVFRRLELPFYPSRGLPRRAVWLHAVSVGEAAAARPLVARLRSAGFGPLFATATTATGYRALGTFFPGLPRAYFPFDLPLAWRSFLARARPRLFIGLETELWPNLMRALDRRGVPLALLNGRLSRRSWRRYRRARFMLRPLLAGNCWFGMRSRREADWLIDLGAPPARVTVTGNLKYDQALALAAVAAPAEILPGGRVAMFASLHPGEEETAVETARQLKAEFPGTTFIFAPRHPERGRLPDLLARAGLSHRLFSAFRPLLAADVLLVDRLGFLGELYPAACAVFVGGSLVEGGGQNMLEPAAFAKPVAFGPHTSDFAEEAGLLLERRAACLTPDDAAVTAFFRRALAGDEQTLALGGRARAVVRSRAGAADRSLEVLRRALAESGA